MAAAKRQFDVIVLGASGFTGNIVAEHMLRFAPRTLRWALGGRSAEKLEKVKSALATSYPDESERAEALEVVVGDAQSPDDADRIARSTKVVLTTVGPYSLYGGEILRACVAAKTHYCDLTGETPWIRRSIDKYHDEAARNGVSIVHCCGFDSVPSDLGTLLIANRIKSEHGLGTQSVMSVMTKKNGGVSGGTIASMFALFDTFPLSELKRTGKPAYLNPPTKAVTSDPGDRHWISYSPTLKRWLYPFVMAPINTRIVRRSAALLGYGKNFTYDEADSSPSVFVAAIAAVLTSAVMLLFAVAPLRRLLQRLAPAPGSGPSAEFRAKSFFEMTLTGLSERAKDGAQYEVTATVSGGCPGYGDTAKMLSEAAIILATTERVGGVLPPAVALGAPYIERLRNVGVAFEIKRDAKVSN